MTEVSTILCRQCGSAMWKTKKDEKNIVMQLLGVVVFLIGLCLLFAFPIGTVIGIVLMLVACQMGFKRKKVWKCDACGYYFERA